MDLVDALRQAEKKGMKSAKRGAELFRAGIHQAEASICHTAQLYVWSESAPPAPDAQREGEGTPPAKVRTGIVSVNGQDVGKMRCTGGR